MGFWLVQSLRGALQPQATSAGTPQLQIVLCQSPGSLAALIPSAGTALPLTM